MNAAMKFGGESGLRGSMGMSTSTYRLRIQVQSSNGQCSMSFELLTIQLPV